MNEPSAEIFKSSKKESNVNLVIKQIKTLIMDGILNPGDKLPNEQNLSKQLQVSRGTTREAMKILSAYGIVNIKQGDGTYISSDAGKSLIDPLLFNMLLSVEDKEKLLELRELLELGIETLIIRNAEDDDIYELERINNELAEKISSQLYSIEELADFDLAFHSALGKATRNRYIEQIYNFALKLLAPSIIKTHEKENSAENVVRLHGNIIKALKSRDSDRAFKAVKESINEWVDLL